MHLFKSISVIAILFLAGCTQTSAPETYLVEQPGPYLLDAGDSVRVSVYGEPDLSTNYTLDDSGTINVPLIGRVSAKGTTTTDLSKRIANALSAGYLRNPNVAVEVAQYRPYFIQGAVRSSGQYPYVYGMTIRSAISSGGGFTEVATRTHAVVYRRNGSAMAKGNVSLDFPVRPGDTIVIEERWF